MTYPTSDREVRLRFDATVVEEWDILDTEHLPSGEHVDVPPEDARYSITKIINMDVKFPLAHYEKFIERKFDRVIDIWGADHQGHVSRLKAAIDSVGGNSEGLDVLLYQLVTLRRGDEIVPLSKRAGEIVTLANVVAEVGEDAARYFFLATGANQPMEFDLELAVKQSDDNPVYYIQYAHARISSILDLAAEQKLDSRNANTDLLTDAAEIKLIVSLLLFPEIVERVLSDLAPHPLPHYARELAAFFHNFYGQCRVVQVENPELSSSRLLLLEATRNVLARILGLMGISAPESM